MLTGLRGRVHARCSIGFCPQWTSCPCPCPASGVAPCPSRSTRGPCGLVESQVVVQRIACGRSRARTVLAGRIWGSVKSAGHHDHGYGSRRNTGPVLHRCSNPRPTTATDPPRQPRPVRTTPRRGSVAPGAARGPERRDRRPPASVAAPLRPIAAPRRQPALRDRPAGHRTSADPNPARTAGGIGIGLVPLCTRRSGRRLRRWPAPPG